MRFLNKTSSIILAAVFGLSAAVIAFAGTASADCYQYNANGFTTSATPVFNNICGVPEGIGNESSFVRIRPDVNGNDEDNDNNPAYTVGTLDSACTSGSLYDVWNYLHNDASTAYNPDTNPSDPSAVAQDVKEDLTATFGTNSTFNFGDTVTASNAATVSDTATLDCGSNQVQLSLVSGSVHIYSIPYNEWENLSDSTVNGGPFLVGSTDTGGFGSGTMWGCWNYRIVIVYQVEATVVPKTTTTPPVCNVLTADQADVESIKYTANSANVTGFSLDVYSGNNVTSGTPVASSGNISPSALPYQFSISGLSAGQYTIVGTVLTNMGNVTSAGCTSVFTVTTPTTTTTTTTSSTTPITTTSLINTGPGTGGIVGIFAGTAVAGTGLYYWLLRRHLAKK